MEPKLWFYIVDDNRQDTLCRLCSMNYLEHQMLTITRPRHRHSHLWFSLKLLDCGFQVSILVDATHKDALQCKAYLECRESLPHTASGMHLSLRQKLSKASMKPHPHFRLGPRVRSQYTSFWLCLTLFRAGQASIAFEISIHSWPNSSSSSSMRR